MRPNVTDQLEGMCRILETAIAPEIENGYTQETLRSLVANVRMLGRAWHRLLPFLHWDNRLTAELLAAARANVAPTLRAEIEVALADIDLDTADGLAAEARNERLRALLSDCLDCPPPLVERIADHLAERAVRYPLRLTGAVPKHKS